MSYLLDLRRSREETGDNHCFQGIRRRARDLVGRDGLFKKYYAEEEAYLSSGSEEKEEGGREYPPRQRMALEWRSAAVNLVPD